MPEFTEDDYIELAAALEMHRALHIVAAVSALPVGGKDADAPTPFQAGYQLACEEIGERIRTQEVVIPGGAVLPQCGTLPSVAQPPAQGVGLLEAVDYVLNQAPCDCPHSMRFERGEHMSGCYLFDLNVEYAKTPTAQAPVAEPRGEFICERCGIRQDAPSDGAAPF